jgi:hypothetical protein
MSSILAAEVGGFAVSKILDVGFAMAEAGLNRAEVVDEARTMEAQGLAPEQVFQTLVDKRKAAHADLARALGQVP